MKILKRALVLCLTLALIIPICTSTVGNAKIKAKKLVWYSGSIPGTRAIKVTSELFNFDNLMTDIVDFFDKDYVYETNQASGPSTVPLVDRKSMKLITANKSTNLGIQLSDASCYFVIKIYDFSTCSNKTIRVRTQASSNSVNFKPVVDYVTRIKNNTTKFPSNSIVQDIQCYLSRPGEEKLLRYYISSVDGKSRFNFHDDIRFKS